MKIFKLFLGFSLFIGLIFVDALPIYGQSDDYVDPRGAIRSAKDMALHDADGHIYPYTDIRSAFVTGVSSNTNVDISTGTRGLELVSVDTVTACGGGIKIVSLTAPATSNTYFILQDSTTLDLSKRVWYFPVTGTEARPGLNHYDLSKNPIYIDLAAEVKMGGGGIQSVDIKYFPLDWQPIGKRR